jgi:Holliday junction resolvase RusA-like endonuclease
LILKFTIPIEPKGKKEARRKRNGQTYKDPETREYMDSIAQIVRSQYRGPPLDGPLQVEYRCYRPRPKSAGKCIWAATRPDWDNYAKAIGDALQGILWVEDSRITDGRVLKLYADGDPRIEIAVNTLSDIEDTI